MVPTVRIGRGIDGQAFISHASGILYEHTAEQALSIPTTTCGRALKKEGCFSSG